MILTPSKLLKLTEIDEKLKITQEEYEELMQLQQDIQVPPHILGLIHHIKRSVRERNTTYELEGQIYLSDRRWRKITVLLRTSALLNGRKEVHLMDSFLIADCLWQSPEQIEEMKDLVKGSIASFGFMELARIRSIGKDLEELRREIKQVTQVIETSTGDEIAIRSMMYLSLSFDHRVVDGYLGGSFLRRVADYLENFDTQQTL